MVPGPIQSLVYKTYNLCTGCKTQFVCFRKYPDMDYNNNYVHHKSQCYATMLHYYAILQCYYQVWTYVYTLNITLHYTLILWTSQITK